VRCFRAVTCRERARVKTGDRLSALDVRVNCMNLLVAGSDTSSSALAATFFYLSRNRDAYSKVAAEVRTAFKSRYEIRAGTLLNGCVYLRAAINEAMRMSPVVAQPL
jgi:cytochrome P450